MSQSLDRYVGRAIVGSLAAALVFFLFLTILIDLLGNLGGYLDRTDRMGMGTLGLFWFLGGYYLRLLPFSFVSIAPFVTVIGCMFAIARLMAQNELQPMLFVGRSMARVLRPTIAAAGVMALLMGTCWQWVVPTMASDITAAQTVLSGGQRAIKNLVLEQRGAAFTGLAIAEYDPAGRRMTGVRLLRVDADAARTHLIEAAAATWDDAAQDWRLEQGLRRTAENDRPVAFLGAGEWTPKLVQQRGQDTVPVELLSYDELLATRSERPNRKDVAMALHRHVTYPLANFVLLLLALPFAIHFERGSRVERVLGAIGVCVAYLLFDLTCQNLGYNGWLHPVVAAWSPTILFGSLGVVMFSSVRS